MGRRRNDKKAEEAIDMYNRGFSFTDIAKNIGGTRKTISRLIGKRIILPSIVRSPAEAQYFDGNKYTKRVSGYFMKTKAPRTLMHRDLWEYHNGEIPDGHVIHHKDENKYNNTIDNLDMMTKSEHTIYHNRC